MEMLEEHPLERLRSMVKDFPHSLQLEDLTRVKTEKCKAILQRIQSERGRPWELVEEGIRGDNFISLLHFRLGEKDKALGINASVLEKYPTNITALVNRAYMKMTTGCEKESMDTASKLQILMHQEGFKAMLATATAEEAYSFSRIGPKFYTRSIDLFQKAVFQFPNNYLWKFGCALTCRRCLKLPNCVEELTVEKLKTLIICAMNYLHDVAMCATNGTLRPRAWVELGELLGLLKSPVYPLSPQIVEEIKVNIIHTDAEECFDMALQMEGVQTDEIVLQRCGRNLRFLRPCRLYKRTLQECYKLLSMAYKLRPTPFACDNLATVLLKMVESGIEPNRNAIFFYQQNGPGKRGRGHRGQSQVQGQRRSCRRLRSNSFADFHGRGRKYHSYDTRPNYTRINEERAHWVVPVLHSGRTRPHSRGRYPRGARRCLDYNEEASKKSSLNPRANDFVPGGLISMDNVDAEGAVGGMDKSEIKTDDFYGSATDIDSITDNIGEMTIYDRRKRHSSKSKEKFKKTLNSPKKVQVYASDHTLLNEAVNYLCESITLTVECNKTAMYTLGMMYRRLGKPDEAVEQFRQIFSDHDISSLYHKINAYEQTGFCLLEMSEDRKLNDEQRQHHRDESKHMMRRAIEFAAKLVARTPAMRRDDLDSWQAYPTLRQLLCNERRRDDLKDIAHLCELIGDHRESLIFYQELRKVDPEDTDLLSKMIKSYMRLKDFHNAQAFLNILLCTSDGRKMMEENANLVYQVYLGTARDLVMSGSFEEKSLLQHSCRSAFEHKHGETSGEDEQNWDVFILDDPKQTNTEATALQSWLKDTCGLSVTRNDDEVPGGELTLYAEVDLITHSKCLIVVVGSVDTKRQKTLVTIALGADSPKIIIPVLTCSRELPVMLTGLRPVLASNENPRDPRMLIHCLLSLLVLDHDQFEWLE